MLYYRPILQYKNIIAPDSKSNIFRPGLWLKQSRQMPIAYESKAAYESEDFLLCPLPFLIKKGVYKIYKK